MKICFVVEDIYPTLSRGEEADGRSVLLINLGKGLVDRGSEVSYVTMDYGQQETENIDGCVVYKMFRLREGIPGFRFVFNKIPKLTRALKRANAEIYVFMCPDPLAGIISWYCNKYDRRFVYYGAHDNDFDSNAWKMNLRDYYFFRYSLKRTSLVLCQNECQVRTLRDNYGIDGQILRNPMEPAERTYNKNGHILWMAKYYPVKRPELYIELSKSIDDNFVMIGGKPPNMMEEQFNKINSCASNPNLSVLGKLEYNVADSILAKSKLFVNTSKREGLANTFLQAWRRGIPVVSFVDPDNMIRDNQLGIVVNSFEELVEAVEELREGVTERYSRRIRDFFKVTFSRKIVIERFEQLLNKNC